MEHSRSASQKGNLSFRQYWLNRTKELCNTINRKIISKVQFGVEKFKKTDKNITLVPTKFSTEIFENLSRKELANLSATFRDLFHFINKFGKLHNVRDESIVHFVDDQLQKTETNTSGIFQLHFYEYLFAPDFKSSIINDSKLTRNAAWNLLNKIFELDKNANEERMTEFDKNHSIKFST